MLAAAVHVIHESPALCTICLQTCSSSSMMRSVSWCPRLNLKPGSSPIVWGAGSDGTLTSSGAAGIACHAARNVQGGEERERESKPQLTHPTSRAAQRCGGEVGRPQQSHVVRRESKRILNGSLEHPRDVRGHVMFVDSI